MRRHWRRSHVNRSLGLRRDRFADGGAVADRQPGLRGDLVLVDPALHADGAEGGLGGGAAEVDIRFQGVQRHAAFAVPLAPRHLGSAKPAAAIDSDALRAGAHCAQDRLLHRALVADAALDLRRDVFGDQLRVQLGLLDLLDGDAHAVAEALLEIFAKLVYRRPALADDDARLA